MKNVRVKKLTENYGFAKVFYVNSIEYGFG